MGEGAPKAIHFPNDKSVARHKIGENRIQSSALLRTSTDAVVAENSLTSCRPERIALQGEGLSGSGNSGISHKHRRSRRTDVGFHVS